ncbi:MAG TPA: ornithine carbamoyltransferase [Verrucomicrobiales bacterium]|jgi:ornithine carbamoyltransferase|nr:ornithine carbamoyltransferase [Verrucomicrobiales bacterium]
MEHLLSIEAMYPQNMVKYIDHAVTLKTRRGKHEEFPLEGQVWALLFSKSSTRTRVSFEVGIRELGGSPLFLSSNDIQLGRGEPIKDTARVLGRLVHGAIIRTFAQSDVEEFADYSGIPTINALTDDEHPCQILADLLTIREKLGGWDGRKIAFVGDGCNNMARSWCWAAKHLGFSLTIGSPEACQPPADFLGRLDTSNITITSDPAEAVADADVVNTDAWLSMGQEGQTGKEAQFGSYQVNSALLQGAAPNHIVLHCLPAYRGKEISEDVLEQHADTIFQQAENRLHIQKGIMARMAKHRVL